MGYDQLAIVHELHLTVQDSPIVKSRQYRRIHWILGFPQLVSRFEGAAFRSGYIALAIMVLLTPSTVSAILSGGIVCTFTFLLFLSGYVLQQQSVRSLQDAIRNPPEKLSFPIPTLPPQFRHLDEGIQVRRGELQQVVLSESAAQAVLKTQEDESILQTLWKQYLQDSGQANDLEPAYVENLPSSDSEGLDVQTTNMIVTRESLAYITILPDTNSLCSAMLFAQRHRESTRLKVQPYMVFIYPGTWDVSDTPSHMAAMDLLRDLQDNHGVTLHPVTISRVWAGITTQQQLLAELQRYRWPYDRAMYVASPGMLLNTSMLDEGLALSDTKASWTILHPNPKSHEASHPSQMLWVAGRGLLYPSLDVKKLTSRATTVRSKQSLDQLAIDAVSTQPAYVLFKEKELGYRYKEKKIRNDLFERFEKDRREVCAGTGLFDS